MKLDARIVFSQASNCNMKSHFTSTFVSLLNIIKTSKGIRILKTH